MMILLAYSDGRFGGLCPPRCIWFCTWFGRQSRPNQVQKRNVSGACGPRTPGWRVCQQYPMIVLVPVSSVEISLYMLKKDCNGIWPSSPYDTAHGSRDCQHADRDDAGRLDPAR